MDSELLRKITDYAYLDVIEKIKNMAEERDSLIISLDGPCGSGKTTLAMILEQVFDCNLFHVDDFFIPFEMRTKERMKKGGRNIDSTRIKREIIDPLINSKTVAFRPYRCSYGAYGCEIRKNYKKINIIEGSYSMNVFLREYYDFSIFLTVNSDEQIQRILNRSCQEVLENFINKWIPMEEEYFKSEKIRELCNIVIDTSFKN